MSIKLENVSMRYKKTIALDNVSVTFESGKVYGLLGGNGAGKTTLLNLITNRIFPTDGKILIDDEKAMERDESQQKVFFVGELNYYPGNMKVQDILYWASWFYPQFNTSKARQLTDFFHVDPKSRLDSLPTGYKSVLKGILALSVGTPYVLMDEPLLGMDALHREQFYEELRKMLSFNVGTTVILSTHIIEEVVPILDHIVILDKGRILRDEPVQSLITSGYYAIGPENAVLDYAQDKTVLRQEHDGDQLLLMIDGSPESVIPEGITIRPLDLQKLFIHLTEGGAAK